MTKQHFIPESEARTALSRPIVETVRDTVSTFCRRLIHNYRLVLILGLLLAGYAVGWTLGRFAMPSVGLAIGVLIALVWGSLLVRDALQERKSAWPTVPTLVVARAMLARIEQVRAERLEWLLFFLSLVVYSVTRFVGIERFPIYFFTDEAIHPVLGAELFARGFRAADGSHFPSYFQNGPYWNLSLSVYLHGLTATIFGTSIVVTRLTSALVSLSAAFAVGLILKLIFQRRIWWFAVMILTILPVWFMHSRTAFEAVLMVSFYAWFLLFYLLYRYRSPKYLFLALLLGAATFYSYANGQAVMGVSVVLLALSDLRYHLRHWRTVLLALAAGLILEAPYVRFRSLHPEAIVSQLRILDSYLFYAITPQEKVSHFATRYVRALSPTFWFFPSSTELIRHVWKGSGFFPLPLLPFWLAGLVVVLRHYNSSAYRAVVIAMLAAPFGGALTDVGIMRVAAFIVPSAILMTLGVDWLFRLRASHKVYIGGVLAALIIMSTTSYAMLREALVSAPVWYEDYGLYGMQWGARQIFQQAVPKYLRQNPDARVLVSPSWANGTDIFLRFSLPNEPRIEILNVDAFISEKHPIDPLMVFVMTPEEVQRAKDSRKFDRLQVEQTIPYPNSATGFVFARLAYVPNIDEIFHAEAEARARSVTSRVTIQGDQVTVNHPVLDNGRIEDAVDGDLFTLARVRDANPAIFEFIYSSPRSLHTLAADFGSMDFELTVSLFDADQSKPTIVTQSYRGLPPDPHVELPLNSAPPLVSMVRIEVKALNAGDVAKIHVRELNLR